MGLPNIIQQINSKLPLSGGTMTGAITMKGGYVISSNEEVGFKTPDNNSCIVVRNGNHPTKPHLISLISNNGTSASTLDVDASNYCINVNCPIKSSLETVTWLNGNKGRSVINSNVSSGQYTTLWKYPSTNGVFTLSGWKEGIYLNYTANDIINNETNSTTHSIQLLNESNNSAAFQYVTAYSRSGSLWCRKWSSGFIEQGGNFSNSARGTTITFPIAFTNTNYQALACINHANDGWSATTTACIRARTTSNMVVQIYFDTNHTTGLNSWYACGY